MNNVEKFANENAGVLTPLRVVDSGPALATPVIVATKAAAAFTYTMISAGESHCPSIAPAGGTVPNSGSVGALLSVRAAGLN